MKPAELFYHCNKRKRGRDYKCKACKSAIDKQRGKERRKRYNKAMAALEEVRYEKVCRVCRRLLPKHMFPKCSTSCDYLSPYCRECYSRINRKRQYGLSDERLDEMLAVKTCQMPGCGEKLTNGQGACIDHCHASGKVRAVLCQKCNTMLGYIEKNLHLVQPMLDYINEHKGGNEAA
jgi:hypothetical protein